MGGDYTCKVAKASLMGSEMIAISQKATCEIVLRSGKFCEYLVCSRCSIRYARLIGGLVKVPVVRFNNGRIAWTDITYETILLHLTMQSRKLIPWVTLKHIQSNFMLDIEEVR